MFIPVVHSHLFSEHNNEDHAYNCKQDSKNCQHTVACKEGNVHCISGMGHGFVICTK